MPQEPYIKSLEELSQLNVEKILALILDIDEKLQLSNSSEIMIGMNSKYDSELIKNKIVESQEYVLAREESLNFLKSRGIITYYKQIIQIRVIRGIKIIVDVQKYKKFKNEIEKLHKRKFFTNNSDNLQEFDLPEGTRWEEIIMRFKDDSILKITINDKTYQKDYKQLGFENKSSKLTVDSTEITSN